MKIPTEFLQNLSIISVPYEDLKRFDNDSQGFIVSLNCRFSGYELIFPARSKKCKHLDCVELEFYYSYTSEFKKCLICDSECSLKDIEVDFYLKSIMEVARAFQDNDCKYIKLSINEIGVISWNYFEYQLKNTEVYHLFDYSIVSNNNDKLKKATQSIYENFKINTVQTFDSEVFFEDPNFDYKLVKKCKFILCIIQISDNIVEFIENSKKIRENLNIPIYNIFLIDDEDKNEPIYVNCSEELTSTFNFLNEDNNLSELNLNENSNILTTSEIYEKNKEILFGKLFSYIN